MNKRIFYNFRHALCNLPSLWHSEYIENYSNVLPKLRILLFLCLEKNQAKVNKFFQAQSYLRLNPDIKEAWNASPVLHFLIHGVKENRECNESKFLNKRALKPTDPRYLLLSIDKQKLANEISIDILFLTSLPRSDGVWTWRILFQKMLYENKGLKVAIENYGAPSKDFIALVNAAKTVIFVRPNLNSDYFLIKKTLIELKKEIYWDLDDLIFSPEHSHFSGSYLSGLNYKIQSEDEKRLREIISISKVICSTTKIRERVLEICPGATVRISKNRFPPQFLKTICCTKKNNDKNEFNMLFLSGSTTHDYDVSTIFPQLLNFLLDNDEIKLTLIGKTNLFSTPPRILQDKVKTLPYMGYTEYLTTIGNYDLVIFPLDKNPFNDCKSCIKYLEAGLSKVPILVSRTNEYSLEIKDGVNGFLYDPEEFYAKLDFIKKNPSLAQRVGETAYKEITDSSI